MTPFSDALARVRALVLELRGRGFDIRYLDFGGGLGITYADETPPDAEGLRGGAPPRRPRDLGVTLLLEPGRVIVGNAGILLAASSTLKTPTRSAS